jgi:hypothetical protein
VFGLTGGPHFTPNFFLARKETFERTDGQFNPKGWHRGDYIAPLDLVCEHDEYADRFVWASIQMRARRPKVMRLTQWVAPEYPSSDLFQEGLPWVHLGGLGQGKEALTDENGLMIAMREQGWRGNVDAVDVVSPAHWEKKLAAWMLCRQHFPIRDPGAEYYNRLFDFAVSNVLSRKASVVSEDRIQSLIAAYSEVLAPILA